MPVKWLRIASVTTYSSISFRITSSSVWSTLMTSSIRRSILFANSVLMACGVVIESPSEDLRPVVVFRIEHTHEPQAGRAVERSGIEQHRGDRDAPLELFEQGERAVHREQRAGPEDEDGVEMRVAILGELRSDQIDERCVVGQDRVDGLDQRGGPRLALGVEPFLEGALRAHGRIETPGERHAARRPLACLLE